MIINTDNDLSRLIKRRNFFLNLEGQFFTLELPFSDRRLFLGSSGVRDLTGEKKTPVPEKSR